MKSCSTMGIIITVLLSTHFLRLNGQVKNILQDNCITINFPFGKKNFNPEVRTTVLLPEDKAKRHFTKAFPEVSSVNWELKITGGIVARFNKNNIDFTIYYHSNGQPDCIRKGYSAEYLNPEIKALIARVYPESSIKMVSEFYRNGNTDYILDLVDKNFNRQIKIARGEIKVVFERENSNCCNDSLLTRNKSN